MGTSTYIAIDIVESTGPADYHHHRGIISGEVGSPVRVSAFEGSIMGREEAPDNTCISVASEENHEETARKAVFVKISVMVRKNYA